jgi:broad specificity phosphatase PhoE
MASTVKSVTLIRHARSIANDDPTVYLTMPDHTIPLVVPDHDPAAMSAGEILRSSNIDSSQLCAWYSPYLRTRQTMSTILRCAYGHEATAINKRESFLLREQEFGDWDSLTDEEILARDPDRFERRQRLTDSLGRFYFRYPHGESRADVAQRVVLFIGKLQRSAYPHHVVFLHGVTQRAFRMAWLNLRAEWFEREPNPDNASVLQLTRDASNRWTEKYLTKPP